MMTLAPPRPAPATEAGSVPRAAIGDRKSRFYRHDLDGLRGIAIALVAMFHVWFGRVSGGVDVFLALSGFFFGENCFAQRSIPRRHCHHYLRWSGWYADCCRLWWWCWPDARC